MKSFLLVACFCTGLFFNTASAMVATGGTDKLICAMSHALLYKSEIDSLKHDKVKHCSLSCMIARKCKVEETILAGVIKEIADALGMGNPEIRDLEANLIGIAFSYKVKRRSECVSLCKEQYK